MLYAKQNGCRPDTTANRVQLSGGAQFCLLSKADHIELCTAGGGSLAVGQVSQETAKVTFWL